MAVEQFKEYLRKQNLIDISVVIAAESTHTAEHAAKVHGVPVSNIVKSLLLMGQEGKSYLVLVPGDKRLDIDEFSIFVCEKVNMASPSDVKRITGYSIGGVPPFGHLIQSPTYIARGFDKDISLYAAAGAGNAVFKVSYDKLKEYTEAIEL